MIKKTFFMALLICSSWVCKSQSIEVQQLLLNVEKLSQLKNILSDMKKGYQVVSSGYNTIKDISEGNFKLHDAFISGLMKVSPFVKKYHKVVEIVDDQKNLVKEYQQAYQNFKNADIFNPSEITYIGQVYEHLFKQSLRDLDDLAIVITSSNLSMSDEERLNAIDKIFLKSEDKLKFLRSFNQKTSVLAIQRTRELNEIEEIKRIQSSSKN